MCLRACSFMHPGCQPQIIAQGIPVRFPGMSLRKHTRAAPQPYRGPGVAGRGSSGSGSGSGIYDTDPYAVLSMHQPWASLLVCGIKRIEGRSWLSKHRGRLWIHSTSQKPTDADIQVHAARSDPKEAQQCALQKER